MSYAKTEAGRQEIEARTRRLPTALRSILLMVDGQRGDTELRALIEGLKAPADAIEQLIAMELIVDNRPPMVVAMAAPLRAATAAVASEAGELPRDAAQEYRRLYERMSGAVTRYLGIKGYFLQLKIERCEDAQALHALMPELEAALRKARGAAFTTQWLEQTLQPVPS